MTWNNSYGLNARILVAAGGGGTDDTSFTAEISCGGGLESEGMSSYEGTTTGATQTKGGHYDRASPYYTNVDGLFGEGGSSTTSNYFSAGGGGGYWGGVANDVCGQGGSSFISGHPGCIAIKSAESRDPSTAGSDNSVERATHYSGLYFTETVMIDGAGNQWTTSKGSKKLMPKPTGGADKYSTGEGHTGNGYARLFCIPFD